MNYTFKEALKILKELNFHKFNAKSSGESLLMHSFNTYFLVSKLVKYIPNLTEDDKLKLKIASLLHDYGKTSTEFQEKLHGAHKIKEIDIPTLKDVILKIKQFSSKDLDDIIYIIENHHSIDLEKVTSERCRLTRIVSICDSIVSNQSINEEIINLVRTLIDTLDYECCLVELIEHPISSYIIGAFDNIYNRQGIEPILFAKNGTVFIKKKDVNLPSPEEINKFLNEQIQDEFGSKGILKLNDSNNRIYTNDSAFLDLAAVPTKFIDIAAEEVERRLINLKKKDSWTTEKEKVYLLGRVCGTVYNSLFELLEPSTSKITMPHIEKAPFSRSLGGRADDKTVGFIENKYGKNLSYKIILKSILEEFKDKIVTNQKANASPYDVRDLLVKVKSFQQDKIDVQTEAKNDYNQYWEKNPISVCRTCHTFKQEIATAALFPGSDLGGKTDVFYTDLMRLSPEFKDRGGVCKWCRLWFMLLKNKTGNQMYKLCIYPHSLFGRIDWGEMFEDTNIISIGDSLENYIYPHIAVIGLSGKTYGDFISQLVKKKLLDKLYDNGLRGKVISTLIDTSTCLFDCGSIKIAASQYPLFKPILDNIKGNVGSNVYAFSIKSIESNKYSWGQLIKTNKVNNDPRDNEVVNMVREMGTQTGLSFLNNIWIGGTSENRISNAEKVIRRINETLRKLKDKEKTEIVIDAMVAIGRKVVLSTRNFQDWGDKRRQDEIDALRLLSEKLYEYREKSSERTELIRAMSCYLGYIPYTIEGGSK